jgi:hypothetical protein
MGGWNKSRRTRGGGDGAPRATTKALPVGSDDCRQGARAPAGRAHPAHGSAPSPGWPAWSAGPSAATTPSNRPRIVLESSSNRPRTVPEPSSNRPRGFRPASPKDPATVPTGRARPAQGSAPSPGWPAWSAGPSSATTPSNRPRTVPEPAPKVPASFPQGSGQPPPPGRARPRRAADVLLAAARPSKTSHLQPPASRPNPRSLSGLELSESGVGRKFGGEKKRSAKGFSSGRAKGGPRVVAPGGFRPRGGRRRGGGGVCRCRRG